MIWKILRLFKLIKKLFQFILNILYPNHCISCKNIINSDKTFCINCWKKLQFINKPCCSICSEPFKFNIFDEDELLCGNCIKKKPYFDKAISCFIYNKTISRTILQFKFFKKTFLSKVLVKFLLISTKDVINEVDYLIPVPIDIKRLRWRGYNQSLLLTKELSKKTNKPIIEDLLIKHKYTIPQARLKNKDRKKNLKNVFSFNEKYFDLIQNKNIAILDDVMTTGTTVNECAKILKQQGVNKVFVFTIAKTSLHKNDFLFN